MVILIFAFAAILILFTNCSILNESNRSLIIAVSHAQRVMEEMTEEVQDKHTLLSLRNKIDDGVTWRWDDDSDFSTAGLQRLSGENVIACCYNSTSTGWCCPPGCSCPDEDPLHVRVTGSWDNRRGSTDKRNIILENLITVP